MGIKEERGGGISQFYINYKECKYLIRWKLCEKQLSFILTIRNVNQVTKENIEAVGECFILTIRNVNMGEAMLKIILVFGFILTIRNIKKIVRITK